MMLIPFQGIEKALKGLLGHILRVTPVGDMQVTVAEDFLVVFPDQPLSGFGVAVFDLTDV